MHTHLSRHTAGFAGFLGALLLIVWAGGFLLLGAHARGFHLLVPIGMALVLFQAVRRVDHEGAD